MSVSSKTCLSIALLLEIALSSASYAADLPPVSEPPPPPRAAVPPPAEWSGLYFGAFGGFSSINAKQGYALSSATLAGLPPVIPYLQGLGSQSLGLRGTDAGVQAGYDWNLGNRFVVGVAGDADVSSLQGRLSISGKLPPAGGALPLTMTQALDRTWGGSLRLRAGYAPIDNLLLYATGGGALAQFNYSQGFWDTANETENAVFHAVRGGWTVGAGAEWVFLRNWSVMAEYRHTEYAAVTGMGSAVLTDGTVATAQHSTGTIREDNVRVGVNYRFP